MRGAALRMGGQCPLGGLAPRQGAAQRAVHSPRDGGHDVVEGGGDGRTLGDAVVFAQRALDAIDHRGGDVAQVRVTVAVPVFELRLRDVLEWISHESPPCWWSAFPSGPAPADWARRGAME